MNMKKLGAMCKKFRLSKGFLQSDVATACGCSRENIAAFEQGRNDSAVILLWYISKGLKVD